MSFDDINFINFIDILKSELQKELPGYEIQKTMSPSIREDLLGNTTPNLHTRLSAILILLFPNNEEISTVFIKRPVYNGPHSGQVSFPGGKLDENDIDIQATALRELDEEIGINPSEVAIIGELTPLYIPISNMMVHPFVGTINHKPKFLPNLQEVEYTIVAPLKDLLDEKNKSLKVFSSNGKIISAPYYNISNEFIWGATAMILAEFLSIIKKSF